MRKLSFFAILALGLILVFSCGKKEDTATIHTEYGDIKIKLYDETPKHKENFLKLVNEGFYDSLLFHRVIRDFMIQGGDPDSKNASPGQPLGQGGLDYTIPAEFNSKFFHKKGAIAAARLSDQVNPDKESSSCQFYIVQGTVMPDQQLDMIEQKLQIKFTEEQRNVYKTLGGTPFLDQNYTVFGEVVEGMDVIDKIATVETDAANRPLKDIRMTID